MLKGVVFWEKSRRAGKKLGELFLMSSELSGGALRLRLSGDLR